MMTTLFKKTIRTTLSRGNSIVVLGNPFVGKTRIIEGALTGLQYIQIDTIGIEGWNYSREAKRFPAETVFWLCDCHNLKTNAIAAYNLSLALGHKKWLWVLESRDHAFQKHGGVLRSTTPEYDKYLMDNLPKHVINIPDVHSQDGGVKNLYEKIMCEHGRADHRLWQTRFDALRNETCFRLEARIWKLGWVEVNACITWAIHQFLGHGEGTDISLFIDNWLDNNDQGNVESITELPNCVTSINCWEEEQYWWLLRVYMAARGSWKLAADITGMGQRELSSLAARHKTRQLAREILWKQYAFEDRQLIIAKLKELTEKKERKEK